MIRKITVKTLKNYDKDKEGNELQGKFGKYFKYGLTCEEFPTKTIYGIGNKALDWKTGEQYDIDLTDDDGEDTLTDDEKAEKVMEYLNDESPHAVELDNGNILYVQF